MGVEKGPSPSSSAPWHAHDEMIYSGGSGHLEVADLEPLSQPGEFGPGLIGAASQGTTDAAAIIHRVNGWDALIAERDALAARVAELEAERDAAEHVALALWDGMGDVYKYSDEIAAMRKRHG